MDFIFNIKCPIGKYFLKEKNNQFVKSIILIFIVIFLNFFNYSSPHHYTIIPADLFSFSPHFLEDPCFVWLHPFQGCACYHYLGGGGVNGHFSWKNQKCSETAFQHRHLIAFRLNPYHAIFHVVFLRQSETECFRKIHLKYRFLQSLLR